MPPERRIERLRVIAREAVEQCGGCRLPRVETMSSLEIDPTIPVFVLDNESENTNLPEKLRALDLRNTEHKSIALIVGPAGP